MGGSWRGLIHGRARDSSQVGGKLYGWKACDFAVILVVVWASEGHYSIFKDLFGEFFFFFL
jgi:hypothetical protein